MKKYRLKSDGSLFPKGTIARQSYYSGNYDILCGGEFIDHVDAARIEGNTNWEEITEDQREEKAYYNPYCECYRGLVSGTGRCICPKKTKKPDHQALREESLREYWDIKIEPTELEKISCIKLYVKEKYADAWRELLDKKEG